MSPARKNEDTDDGPVPAPELHDMLGHDLFLSPRCRSHSQRKTSASLADLWSTGHRQSDLAYPGRLSALQRNQQQSPPILLVPSNDVVFTAGRGRRIRGFWFWNGVWTTRASYRHAAGRRSRRSAVWATFGMTSEPAAGGWRSSISRRFEQPVANALLKILEEPPARSILS